MSVPRRCPYRPGGEYRPTSSFRSRVDSFRMGEVLTFVGETRDEPRRSTIYAFADTAGIERRFEVPDDMPAMALYGYFRAVDARDGGCPECREQRYRGLGPPLRQMGHGSGPIIYHQCQRCLALWEETLREAHIVWDRLLTCPHLKALERDLRTSGVRVELETRDWDDRQAGFHVYFGAGIDREAVLSRFAMPALVEWQEWDGRVAGQEAGFRCTGCRSAVMGVHPLAMAGHPTYPDRMDVPPGRQWLDPAGSPPPGPALRARTLAQELAPLAWLLAALGGAIGLGWWAGRR